MTNDKLNEIYRSCRNTEGLAAQDIYQSADVLLGSEVEQFAEKIIADVCGKLEPHLAQEILEFYGLNMTNI